ncbi:MAG: sugar nucleotide-binding protein [Candidatus Nanoarchaeia archaeon]|nr:sugar nucleotide-binding protein [Candidatus Nanoarchaeia archaeon]
MKGLIFGRGFLGTRLGEAFGYKVIGRDEADATQLSQIIRILDSEQPQVVVNAMGKTGSPNVDWCETHKEETVLSNICAAANLAIECIKRGIYFVHLSSGCIYSGDNNGGGYTEGDEPNFYGPQFYAKTKILAEKILREFPSLILRMRFPIDDRPHVKNLIDKLRNYPRVTDTQNSMTTIPDAINAAKQLIEKRKIGIYNIVNPGTISPAEIMDAYQRIVDPSHSFTRFSEAELSQVTLAKRSNCRLNTDKLKNEGISLPEIHEAVESCLTRYRETSKLKE